MTEQSKGFAKKDTFRAFPKPKFSPVPRIEHVMVTGEVEYRSGGLTASLVKASPQGINPAILILDVHDTKSDDISTEPVITQRVDYTGPAGLKQVTVRSAAPDFTIDVEKR